MSFYALIMAGGGGTRLWPLSRQARPKQVLTLVGERTMFEHAVDRIAPVFQPEETFVVTSVDQVGELMLQAPELPRQNFVIEPLGRGTAPAIGLGAIQLQDDEAAVMAVLTADHFIGDVAQFRRALSAAAQVAERGHLVTLGISPSFPSTAYGYIKQGEKLDKVDGFPVFAAKRFTEKPSPETAFRMVESGLYSWNSGMFIWRVDRIMDEFMNQMPEFYDQLAQISAVRGTPAYEATLRRIWPDVIPQTIDYGVMEGAEDVVVIPVDIGWSDVGNWSSMWDILPTDDERNIVVGDHLGLGTQDSIVFGGKRLIATIGLEDMIVVDTEDALLVCHRDHEQRVRDAVHLLRKRGRQDIL
ncbi:MAG: mannose-1-phosphate guanylyltransferase [Anaerolineae bacterium]|nr:mannose-1-phosphate guanylyltransferase [Anaerolineae bacterium]